MGHTLLLALHIASVGGWLGANYVQIVLAPRMARAGREASLAWTQQSNWLGERYYTVIGGLILVTGILLVNTTDWAASDGFVWVGVAVVILGAVTGVAAFAPLGRRRIEALERGDDSGADAVLRRIIPLAMVDTVFVLVAVLAMVDKWKS